jgi:hypothetical protein
VDLFVDALRLPPQAVGALFSLNGRPVGLELFESPVLCTRLSGKIIRSWALDAIEGSEEQGAFSRPTSDQIADFIETMIATPSKRFQVAGLGETVRFLGDKITGGALVLGDRILHVMVFSLKSVTPRQAEYSGVREPRRSSR